MSRESLCQFRIFHTSIVQCAGTFIRALSSIHYKAYEQFLASLTECRTQQAKMSQEELAEAIGKDQSYVSKVESGRRRLDLVEYVRWMNALDVDPVPLFAQLAENLARSRFRRTMIWDETREQALDNGSAKRTRRRHRLGK